MRPLTLSPLDLAVIALFVLAILALGFSAKLRQNTVLQYLVAGRALTLPVFVATLVSTWYGGILGVCEQVSYYGLGSWLMIGVPFYVFGVIYALAFARRVRAEAQISIPERLESRFGRGVALVGALLILLLALPAAHVLMLGVLVRTFTGWDIATSVVVATLVGTLFLYRGGLLADARVSLLAFLGMYAGFAAMLVWCLIHFPISATWNSIPNRNLLTWDGGQGWPMVLSFFILGAWTLIDPAFHQRAASAVSPEIARKGVLISVGFWFLFDMLSMGTAMYAVALLPPLSESATSIDRLSIFPAFAEQALPSGLRALFLCGMLGTILSAMVGYALVSGATIGREIAARIGRESSDAKVNLWSRIGIAVACVLAVVVGLSVESVVSLWYTWSGAVVGALLLPVCLAYGLLPKWHATPLAVGLATILSAGGALGWMVYGIRTGNPFLTVQWGKHEFSLGTLLPGLAVSAAVMGLGAILAIIRDKNHGRKRSSA